jgi:hypothetical protein
MDYQKFTCEELKDQLKDRGLPTAYARKADLIERLKDDDGKKARGQVSSYRGRDNARGQEQQLRDRRPDNFRIASNELRQVSTSSYFEFHLLHPLGFDFSYLLSDD